MKQFFQTMFASTLGVLIATGILVLGSLFFLMGVAATGSGSSEYKPALNFFGSKSGADCDKFKETGLTPAPSAQVSAPSIAEADLVIECRKTYADWMKPDCFLRAENISTWYPNRDFHKIIFGEVAALSATEQYFL